ncbi:MAG: response regulator transcription factor [Microthrixaceae bacterium]
MRLLVVEDDPGLRETLRRGLTAEGFDVDVATDGNEGYWRASEGCYSAVLLDIMLPKRNGYEVCRDLRQAGVDTPVVVLTAKDGEYDETDALELGADDFVRKPFSHAVLVARLHAAIRRSAGSATTAITVGDLEVHPGRRAVHAGGVQVKLTAREFAVLEVLARKSPDVVSKRELVDEVWGMDFEGDPNVAEVYIGYLRKKVGRRRVRTVRGVGYQLVNGRDS